MGGLSLQTEGVGGIKEKHDMCITGLRICTLNARSTFVGVKTEAHG